MADIIQVLPDSVANQIAAGEVIQRPSSAVKELLENSIDSGSTGIKLIIRDAGKSLIQVIDNGCGMSETDARLSFERHATSKIRKAEDLFRILTMGFRGEALASVASVAQVEMKTRLAGRETGTRIVVEGSMVTTQEPCSCPEGTSITIKNLFFNIPARRNFLKSDAVEVRHITDEFMRVAIAHPEISFSFIQNENETFRLPAGTLRQRLVALYGHSYNERLVPVQEDTSIIKLTGYATKPEFARKTRGEQFFFVNRRYIRDHYLNHAVMGAYDQLLPPDSYPSYFLFIEIDPSRIDVNIHSTKTEIKFEDERSAYAILRSTIKHALGQFSIAPSLDFERESSFDLPLQKEKEIPREPTIRVDPAFNPFRETKNQGVKTSVSHSGESYDWKKLYEGLNRNESSSMDPVTPHQLQTPENTGEEGMIFQAGLRYIVMQTNDGMLIIDQQPAHERILYEKLLSQDGRAGEGAQHRLFPIAMELSPADFSLIKSNEAHFRSLGFDLRDFGKNTYVIHALPVSVTAGEEKEIVENIIEQFRLNAPAAPAGSREILAQLAARRLAVKTGRKLLPAEMRTIATQLFRCSQPAISPSGKTTLIRMTTDELKQKFGK